MILWNLFWGNSVCQYSSVKIIVLRRQANHNAVPTNTNRKTNQTSVFQRPANSLLTEYLVQHRIRHHIDKQLRLEKWHIRSQNSMISEQIVRVANTPCLLLSGCCKGQFCGGSVQFEVKMPCQMSRRMDNLGRVVGGSAPFFRYLPV